ncbi:MAG: hypothetical protein IKE91_03420 [Clostridia bacterium]|nr:hypothetical protein [Clostridia bacterium]
MKKTANKRGKRSNKRKKIKNDKMKKILNILFVALLVVIALTAIGYTVFKDNKTENANGDGKAGTIGSNDLDNNSKSTSDIQDLIDSEDKKYVLDDLKSDKENGRLVYKQGSGSYYEYVFKDNKIKEIYVYTECGNKKVAEYMLNSYQKDDMKAVYSNVEIYKEVAIKAKMSEKLVKTYANYTMNDLMMEMQEEGIELK